MSRPALKIVRLNEGESSAFMKTEKEMAVKALVEGSVFHPLNHDGAGPYELELGIHDGRLVIGMLDGEGQALPTHILSVKPYSRLVRDYFMMVESYEQMRMTGTAGQLEAIDMGRRGLHNEGADLLIDRLKDKIRLDHETARRLFTLICVLHRQHFPVF